MTQKGAETHVAQCKCEHCRNRHPFEMPERIKDALYKGKLVIFAGAGVSTEGAQVPIPTLYDVVKEELGLAPETAMAFSELMSSYCARPDGRARLLHKIYERFEYIKSFPEIYHAVTRFHEELSTLHQAMTIVTTNWDDYFERECGAVPFVTAADFALWDFPGRKVFKIHGSINSIGSVVVTDEDYQRCYRSLRDGILGSTLRQLLATKTVLYAGYGFADEDFQRIHRLLSKEMGALLPHSYILTLDHDADAHFRKLNLTPIYTDATYFISVLKRQVVADRQMIDDERFLGVAGLLDRMHIEHMALYREVDCYEHPEVVYALCYQDGMIHALERMLALMKTGYYSHSCNVRNAIRTYVEIERKKRRARKFPDAAYVVGYVNGLVYLMLDDRLRRHTPFYYVYGAAEQPETFKQFRRLSAKAPLLHKSAYALAKRIVAGLEHNPDHISFHHPAVLRLDA